MSIPTQTTNPRESGFVFRSKMLTINYSDIINNSNWAGFVANATSANLACMNSFPENKIAIFSDRSVWGLEIFANLVTLRCLSNPCLELPNELNQIMDYLTIICKETAKNKVVLANAIQFKIGVYLPSEVTLNSQFLVKNNRSNERTIIGSLASGVEYFYIFSFNDKWELLPNAQSSMAYLKKSPEPQFNFGNNTNQAVPQFNFGNNTNQAVPQFNFGTTPAIPQFNFGTTPAIPQFNFGSTTPSTSLGNTPMPQYNFGSNTTPAITFGGPVDNSFLNGWNWNK